MILAALSETETGYICCTVAACVIVIAISLACVFEDKG
jgi:hypothetical protein